MRPGDGVWKDFSFCTSTLYLGVLVGRDAGSEDGIKLLINTRTVLDVLRVLLKVYVGI